MSDANVFKASFNQILICFMRYVQKLKEIEKDIIRFIKQKDQEKQELFTV